MPPHCDSLDGPVVQAARRALETGDVEVALAFAPAEAEAEIRAAFAAVVPVRALGDAAREVAERHFFETVVRLHRAGEGAPFTGLRPAGLSVGPVIPLAEKALETGDASPVADLLTEALRAEVEARFANVGELERHRGEGLPAARRYTEAALGFQVYAHQLLKAIRGASGHGHGHG